MAPRRFTNGIATVSSADPLGGLEIQDPTKWSVFMEDYGWGRSWNAASYANTTTTVMGSTYTVSANATVSQTTDTGAANGCLKIVTTAADNESALIQSPAGQMILTSNKKFLLETKFEITHTAGTIAENELFIGLASLQTGANFFATNGTARTFDDGIGFYSYDALADIQAICGEADVYSTVTAVATYVTATWYTLTMYYDGTDIKVWSNGNLAGSMTPTAIPISPCGPAIYFKTGEAKVHQLLVDYLLVAKER